VSPRAQLTLENSEDRQGALRFAGFFIGMERISLQRAARRPHLVPVIR
jgi:hypothetical protein